MTNKGKVTAKVKRLLLDFTEDEKKIQEEKQKTKEALKRLTKISKMRND